jgi:hypothetical protein
MAIPDIRVKLVDGTFSSPFIKLEQKVGIDAEGLGIFREIISINIGEPTQALPPLAPALSSSMPSRTSVQLTAIPADNSGRPPITAWEVERRRSLDNGATWDAWAPLNASPLAPGTLTITDGSLAVGTPEIKREYRWRGVNGDGVGAWSNVRTEQWQTVVVQPPTAATNLSTGAATSSSQVLSWTADNDTTVTEQWIMFGNTLHETIGPAVRTYTVGGLAADTSTTNVSIIRNNATNNLQSPKSNTVTITTLPEDSSEVAFMIGCSDSPNAHGGTENWEGWRVYTPSARDAKADRTTNKPTFLAYSEDGPNLGGSNPNYTTVYNHVLAELNDFYYTSATGQTHTNRWDVQLFWSNGNENSDKGCLAASVGTEAVRSARYLISQSALYDAVHYIDPSTGKRRFPNAFAGSDPTHEHEFNGIVEFWLHDSAHKHDFVMWSMYPPGRQNTPADPTYNWPSTNLNDRTNRQLGFFARCFYRTQQARAAARARADTPDDFNIIIGIGETGIGDNPDDSTTRPYYAVHGLCGRFQALCDSTGLIPGFICWWDQQKDATANEPGPHPQNILSTGTAKITVGGGEVAVLGEPANTNPSTRQVLQNWRAYHHSYGGTHPSSWAGNPKSSWTTTGTVV